jgi:hypothetical protein
MFFPELEPKSIDTTDFDTNCARVLAEAITGNNKQMARFSIKSWSKQFTILRQTATEEDILQVLQWFKSNIKDQWTPKAYSAKSFRQKFDRIEEAMNRNKSQDTPISDVARSIYKRLGDLSWKGITGDQVLTTVQISLTNYQEFLAKLQSWEVSCTFMKRAEFVQVQSIFRFTANFLNSNLSTDTQFVEKWIRDIHKMVTSFDTWNGDITKQAFTVSNKRFKQQGREWATAYCGDSSRWDKLMEKLNES